MEIVLVKQNCHIEVWFWPTDSLCCLFKDFQCIILHSFLVSQNTLTNGNVVRNSSHISTFLSLNYLSIELKGYFMVSKAEITKG